MYSSRRGTKVVSITLLTKIIVVVLSFLNTIFINRYLGPSLRGEYTYIVQTANIIQLCLNLGIGYSFSNQKSEESEAKLVSLIMWQTLLLTIVIFPIVFLVPMSYKFIVGLTVLEICNVQIMFIAMISNIKYRNRIVLINSCFYTLMLFCLYIFNFENKIETLMLVVCAKYILEVLSFFIGFKYFKRIKLLDSSLIKFGLHSIKIGLPTMVISLLLACNYNIDVLILEWMNVSKEYIGLYGVAVTLANMAWLVPDAFKDFFYSQNKERVSAKFLINSFAINLLFSACLIIGFAFLGKWFLELVYGESYLDSYFYCIILFIGTIPMSLFKIIHPIMISHNKQLSVCIVLFLSVLTNIIANILLIPDYSVTGVAWASVLSYSICSIVLTLIFILNKKEFLKIETVEECYEANDAEILDKEEE